MRLTKMSGRKKAARLLLAEFFLKEFSRDEIFETVSLVLVEIAKVVQAGS